MRAENSEGQQQESRRAVGAGWKEEVESSFWCLHSPFALFALCSERAVLRAEENKAANKRAEEQLRRTTGEQFERGKLSAKEQRKLQRQRGAEKSSLRAKEI